MTPVGLATGVKGGLEICHQSRFEKLLAICQVKVLDDLLDATKFNE